jgi:hypothetical protein
MKKFLLLLFAIFVLSPISVNSAEIITETDVVLGQNQTFLENVYIGAGTSNISSNVNSDLTVLTGETVISSKVTGDIFVVGGKTEFTGEVEGDLRILAGEVIISGSVLGDLLIVGGDVYISPEATLLNDIVLVGGDINFETNSTDKLKIVSGKARINGKIIGNSDITTQKLELGPNTVIEGIFSYYAPQKFNQSDDVEILGTVNYNQINTIRDTGIIKQAVVNFLNFWLLLRFITTLIIAFLLVSVFKVFAVGVNKIVVSSFWKSLLAGVLTFIFLPVAILVFILSLVAMPIGFLLIITFIFATIIAPAVSGIFLGGWFKKVLGKTQEYEVDFHSAVIGVVLYTILQFIPVIGDFLRFVFVVVSVGAMTRYIYRLILK